MRIPVPVLSILVSFNLVWSKTDDRHKEVEQRSNFAISSTPLSQASNVSWHMVSVPGMSSVPSTTEPMYSTTTIENEGEFQKTTKTVLEFTPSAISDTITASYTTTTVHAKTTFITMNTPIKMSNFSTPKPTSSTPASTAIALTISDPMSNISFGSPTTTGTKPTSLKTDFIHILIYNLIALVKYLIVCLIYNRLVREQQEPELHILDEIEQPIINF